MNFEPFEPFEPSEPLPAPAAPIQPHYFDRPGVVWIVASLLFATVAGHLIPRFAEPDGLRQSLSAVGILDKPATSVASLPLQSTEGPKTQRQEPTRAVSDPQVGSPGTSVALRQF